MTTRRVRHGIVLTLAGLLAGLGIVAAVYWGGGLPHPGEPAARKGMSASSPVPPAGSGPDGAPAAPQAGSAKGTGAAGDASGGGSREARQEPAGGTDPGAGSRKDGTPSKEAVAAGAAEAPRFDIVRIEPNGDAVVAGRGKPNTVVEMLVDGKPVARALADPNGQFAIVPPPLPKGSSEIVLFSRTADGQETRSPQSVAVSISPEGKTRPLVALTAPNAPTVVLSQPGMPETPPVTADAGQGKAADKAGGKAAGTAGADHGAPGATEGQAARIVSVDAEPGGRLYVTGAGKPGAEVRLYLNDTPIAPGKVGPDGRVTFTIGRGVAEGRYRVRLDEIDPANGRVVHRAEVPFTMPQTVASAAQAPAPAPRTGSPGAGSNGAGGTGPEASRKDSAGTASGLAASGKPDRDRTGMATGTPPGTGRAAPPPEAGHVAPGQTADTMGAVPPPAALPAGTGTDGSTGDIRSSAVFVPGIATARIIRGDNLWQISKRTYGRGERYTVIYDANQAQIRDPDLIYPGQIFVLPQDRRG